jgi:pimeloyl-ACP methyl ester carboxylesterase
MIRKMPSTTFLLLTVLAVALLGPAASASDTDKERRWAEQVIDGLLDGEATWLRDASGNEFLGVMTEGDPETGRAVVLMHGIGVHPNWPDILFPLRTGLLDHGITSLSIQMPILANDADAVDYLPLLTEVPGRVDAALKALNDAGYRNITLVAHSMGSTMAVYYLSQVPSAAIDSLVIIGMGPGISGDENIERLGKLRLPVMDLYGGSDLDAVLASADERAAAGKLTGPEYRQVRVAGANHFFQGHEVELVQQVIEWLDARASR